MIMVRDRHLSERLLKMSMEITIMLTLLSKRNKFLSQIKKKSSKTKQKTPQNAKSASLLLVPGWTRKPITQVRKSPRPTPKYTLKTLNLKLKRETFTVNLESLEMFKKW